MLQGRLSEHNLDNVTDLLAPKEKTIIMRFSHTTVRDIFSYTWHNIVNHYSVIHATYEAEKLPALSSLAKTVQSRTGDEYMAGSWKRSLKSDLEWCSRDSDARRPSKYLAPTWSWASVHGKGFFIEQFDDVDFPFTLLDYNITLEGPELFGRVTGGWILVRAVIALRDCVVKWGYGNPHIQRGITLRSWGILDNLRRDWDGIA